MRERENPQTSRWVSSQSGEHPDKKHRPGSLDPSHKQGGEVRESSVSVGFIIHHFLKNRQEQKARQLSWQQETL